MPGKIICIGGPKHEQYIKTNAPYYVVPILTSTAFKEETYRKEVFFFNDYLYGPIKRMEVYIHESFTNAEALDFYKTYMK